MAVVHPRVTEYIGALPSPQKEICLALRERILESFPNMQEDFKWHFAAYYSKGKRICLVGGFKHHATIELHYGALLQAPPGLIAGVGKRTRHIKLKSLAEIDSIPLVDLLQQSIEFAQSGT